jgi:hypothetical protein
LHQPDRRPAARFAAKVGSEVSGRLKFAQAIGPGNENHHSPLGFANIKVNKIFPIFGKFAAYSLQIWRKI